MTTSSQAPPQPFRQGGFETAKFAGRRDAYWEGISRIVEMGYPPADLIHHFPAFAGHVCLGRFLALYEAYKLALGTVGHVAECGVWKGSSLLMLTKLTQLFEPESLTQTHGFDWFRGNHPKPEEAHLVEENSYFESRERIEQLIAAQNLGHLVRLHELDLATDLPAFMARHEHLQFKLVFLDCGLYDVVRACIENFWPRLTPGGILLLDNLNHETAPGEARAVRELLPNAAIHSFPFAQQPTAWIRKPGA